MDVRRELIDGILLLVLEVLCWKVCSVLRFVLAKEESDKN